MPTAGATAQTACAAGTTTLTTGALVCVPVTFTVTPSATATGVITPNTPQQVPVGTAATFQVFTLTANATFVPIIASGPGNCGGTLTGSTYVTAPITANCNVAVSFGPPPPSPASFTTDNPVARFGEIVTLTMRVDGGGTTTFSTDEGNPIPGCLNVPVINGTASCLVPSRYGVLNPLRFIGNYSGDSRNPPFSSVLAPLVQYDNAVLSTSSDAVNPVRAGSQVTVTALVRMRSPVGTVTFYPDNYAPDPLLPLSDTNPRPIAGCEAKPLTMLPSATDSAIVKCTITAPASGSTRVVAYYRYPAGHVSSRAFELEFQPITTIANPPANYTDMWWGGIAQNGWGVSITQHGAIQFNVIYAYDSAGKPTWYVMPGCTWNAANTICTGALYSPTGTPFAQYDATRFVPGAAIGTVSFTYKTAATATMAYTINGVSGSKEIERQVFSTATTEPNLAVNDIWWNGLAENGWGINIAQQGRQLFPVWYTYDTAGKPTFYAVSGGTWNGLVFTGNIYTTTSSPWLGVPYDASKFVVTKVGTMVIDYRDANTATITYNIGDVTQTKLIVRQPY